MTSNTIPISYEEPDLSYTSGSKKLNKNTPIETVKPTIILVGPNLRWLSLTRVHIMATKSTDIRLQDLKAITTGKLVLATAHV